MSNFDALTSSTGNCVDMAEHRPTLVEDTTSVDGQATTVREDELEAYTEVIWHNTSRTPGGLYDSVLLEWLKEYDEAGHQDKDQCAEWVVGDMEARGIVFLQKKHHASDKVYERTELHAVKNKVKRDIKHLLNVMSGKAPFKRGRTHVLGKSEQSVQVGEEPSKGESDSARNRSRKVCRQQTGLQGPLQVEGILEDLSPGVPPGQLFQGTFGERPWQPQACPTMAPGITAFLPLRAPPVSPLDFDVEFLSANLTADLSKTFEEELNNTNVPASVFSQYDGLFENSETPCALLSSSVSPSSCASIPCDRETYASPYELSGPAEIWESTGSDGTMQELVGFTGDFFGRFSGAMENPQVKADLQQMLHDTIPRLKPRLEPPTTNAMGSRKRSRSSDEESSQGQRRGCASGREVM